MITLLAVLGLAISTALLALTFLYAEPVRGTDEPHDHDHDGEDADDGHDRDRWDRESTL